MIDIVTVKGETYSFDPDTLRIFKSGVLLSSAEVEPLFSDSLSGPTFSGIYLKTKNKIISRTGKVSQVDAIESIG